MHEIKYDDLILKLKTNPFILLLDEPAIAALADSGDVRRFKKDEILFREGEFEELWGLILSGSVSVSTAVPDSKFCRLNILRQGEIIGEIAALTGKSRVADIRTVEESEIIFFKKNELFFLMDHSAEFKKNIFDIYHERVLITELKKNPIFSEQPDAFFEDMRRCAEIVTFNQNDTIISYGDLTDDFYIIIHGFAKVLLPDKKKLVCPGGGDKGATLNATWNQNFKIAAYLEPGRHFGEIASFEKRQRMATVTAITRIELIKIGGERYRDLINQYYDLQEMLKKVVLNRKRKNLKIDGNNADQKFLDWAITSNIVQADEILLIDLKKCIKCENCIKTCSDLHGASRLSLNGYKYKNLLIPSSCRHCNDPVCLIGCPVGAIYRDYSGEVAHKKNCIACGNCARRCPYGNIKIVPRTKDGDNFFFNIVNSSGKFYNRDNKKRGYPVRVVGKQNAEAQAKKAERDLKSKKNLIAAKCDNCKDFKKMGCVQNCPRGAAIKVRPGKYFKQLKSG